MLAPIRPIIIGVIRVPELVALTPSTPWKTRGVKMMAPNMPKPESMPTITETVKARFLNRLRGTIGSRSKCSTTTNATSSRTPPISGTSVCQEVQP